MGITYAIRGWLTSSYHGIIHPALNVEIAADLHRENIPQFANALSPTFELDDQTFLFGIIHRTRFFFIHTRTNFKVEIILVKKISNVSG